jgi:N-ethylmaleimide reductase
MNNNSSAQDTSALFEPLQLGALALKNRVLMAPLTRARASAGHMPNDLMQTYYAQRASAGLIVTECTMVAPGTSAFVNEPGIYNAAQIGAWKKVTDAVHAQGGQIVLQIWHAGRAAHPAINGGVETVAPSALGVPGETHTPQGKLPNALPRALEIAEIAALVQNYAQAAKNAREAGFDGVEVHGANGYLIDQFLRDSANQRTDAYGGSLENRARFLLEVLSAVSAAIGSDRVGLRLSPLNSYNGMRDSDPMGWMAFLAQQLNACKLAYLHVMRGDFFQQQTGDPLAVARQHYHGMLVGNMGFTGAEAALAVHRKEVDAVAFGTPFLANPDLPARLHSAAPLNAPDESTFYTPGAKGYTDYPTMAEATA